MARKLTAGEISLLKHMSGNTLLYDLLLINFNKSNINGKNASITSMGYLTWQPPFIHKTTRQVVHMIYGGFYTSTYIHGSGFTVHLWCGKLKLHYLGSYDTEAYQYVLLDGATFDTYSIEQQACIVPDCWLALKGLPPLKNVGVRPSLSDYGPILDGLWSSGPSINAYPGR